MSTRMPDTDPVKREEAGKTSGVPDTDVGEGGRPSGKPGVDVPVEPGKPMPRPANPNHPGGPPEPVDPGKPPTL